MRLEMLPQAYVLPMEIYAAVPRSKRRNLHYEERWPDGRPEIARMARRHRMKDYGVLWRAWSMMPDGILMEMMKTRGWRTR